MTNSTKNRKGRAKKGTQEFFTPATFVQLMIDNCPEDFFKNGEIFHESCCGNGNILELVYTKYRQFHDHDTALSLIYAYDFMEDNVIETIKRLYGPGKIKKLKGTRIPKDMKMEGLIAVFMHNGRLVKNIVCADGNTFLWGQPETIGPNKVIEIG